MYFFQGVERCDWFFFPKKSIAIAVILFISNVFLLKSTSLRCKIFNKF